jgi:predicted enzyme related to lactoylglutathione lyase
MNKNVNAVNWFEIPATDINRAKSFYENIFSIEMEPVMDMMGMQMSFFPAEQGNGKVSGGLVKSEMHTPSTDGAVVYLNANEAGMENVLNKVSTSGGQVVMPKTQISPEIGYMAFFIDTEGNKMALHSQN